MSHRVNVMINDPVWRVFKKIPQGERSLVVNAAIELWSRTRRRSLASQKMDELRQAMPSVSSAKVVQWVRCLRDRHE